MVPWLLPGDALSNDAMAMAAQLLARSPATLHCRGPLHPGLAALVTPGDPPPLSQLIVHIDERSAPLHIFSSPAQSLIIRLHAAVDGSAGRSSFDRCDVVLANSSWTGQRAADRGARRVEVVPPFLPLDSFANAASNAALAGAAAGPPSGALVTVGPFRAGDRPVDAAMVDHLVRTHLVPGAHLVAVGHAPDPSTARAASALCDMLRLGNPFVGHIGHGEYVATLANAGLLLHIAESTGFGAAIVEAMAAGTPVVACAGGAAAETLGGAGVVLDADADPTVVAEAVHAVLTDDALRERLRQAGRVRAIGLSPAASAGRLASVLESLGWW